MVDFPSQDEGSFGVHRRFDAAAGELGRIRETVKLQTLREAEAAMVKAIDLLKRARSEIRNHTVSASGAELLADINDLVGD